MSSNYYSSNINFKFVSINYFLNKIIMNVSNEVIKIAKLASETIKNPTDIPTGDVVYKLIKKLFEENNKISKDDVINLLESQGFNKASMMKEFIEAQIEVMSK